MLKLDVAGPLKPRGIGEQVRKYFTSRGRMSGTRLFFQFSRPTIKRQLVLLDTRVPGASYRFINYVKAAKEGQGEAAYGTRGGALTRVPSSCHLVIFCKHLIS